MRIRSMLRAGASLTAFTVAVSVAHAQSAPPSPSPAPPPPPAITTASEEPAEELVVTGIRAALETSLSTKRDSAQVLDAISAEDIGKFPDKNIGEALQRVTGVQITRAGGEGSGVSIRGADPSLNRVEINGQTALGTGAGAASRAVEFRDLPAEFVSRLEVVKSATADMTEGGLGGTVRIITRRPFDKKEGYLAGSAQTVYGDLSERFDPKFAVIGSKVFANDTIGVLASATYENRSLWYDRAQTTGWRQIDRDVTTAGVQPLDLNNDGKGDFYPDIPRYNINRELTKRYAFNGILEWRPADGIRAFAEGTYTRGKQTINSQFFGINTGQAVANGGVDIPFTVIGPDDTVTQVRFNQALPAPNGPNANYRNILGVIDRQTFNGQLGADWEVTDRFKLTGRAAYAKSKSYNNEINTLATAGGTAFSTIDYNNDYFAPNLITPADPTSTAGINNAQVLRRPRYNNQREIDTKLDAEFKPDGFLTSLRGGVQRRNLKVTSRFFDATKIFNGVTGVTTSSSYATGVSVPVVIATTTPAALQQQIQTIIAQNADLGDHDFFKTGKLGFDGIQRWLNLGLPVANALGIPDPFVNPAPADTWQVDEKNLAGYLSAAFEADFGIKVSGIVGARVINTKTTSIGTIVRAPTITPFRSDGEYTEFLPSLNLKAELIPDKLLARATATDVLARPSPAQLAPRFTLDGVGQTGSRGNPELEPFRARQYDLGVEYYLSRTNYLSATFFRKVITSFIQNVQAPETIDGVVYSVSSPVNGNDKVTVDGVELGGQFAFDFLPAPFNGFGTIANYTYSTDKGYTTKDFFTGGDLSFPGLSKHSYNVSGYFENSVFSARMSYNWRSKFLITPLGRGNNPELGEKFGQWDASFNATLTPILSVFLEGVNVFNSQRYENANSVYRRTIIETYGRRVYAGVRVRL